MQVDGALHQQLLDSGVNVIECRSESLRRDRPPVNAATLDRLCAAFAAAASGIWAIVPEYGGKHGHPVLWDREMIAAFLKAPASSSAREIEHQYQQHIEYVAVDDPAVILNVDTPQDYSALVPAPSK